MVDKDKLIEILVNAVDLGIKALPDSESYEYCWEECTDEEQEKVKIVRKQLFEALELHKVFKKEKENTSD